MRSHHLLTFLLLSLISNYESDLKIDVLVPGGLGVVYWLMFELLCILLYKMKLVGFPLQIHLL